ncbi:hypothetical protein IFM46972_04616 [Aspergillus udagawae]|uniref:Uncharacterized protein n=1 Tax=Aspergillus udagawae TaxID=91492 RepID=A0A8H3NQ49_9EURO|nr:hypothetical protein IFM46972_04616 [Aspergillus udagawae]
MDRERYYNLEDEQEWESIKRTDNALVIALGVYAKKYRDRDLRDFRGFSDHPDLSVYRVDDERVPGIWNELGHRRPMTPTWFIFSSLLDKEKVLEKAVDAYDDFELFSVIKSAAEKSYDIRVRKPLEGKFPNIQVVYSRYVPPKRPTPCV